MEGTVLDWERRDGLDCRCGCTFEIVFRVMPADFVILIWRTSARSDLPNRDEPCCSHSTEFVVDGLVFEFPLPPHYRGLRFSNRGFSGSIGWIAGLGQAGSAMIPFVTGALASSLGIGTLHPL